jgi:hypothetical protein
MQMVIFYLTRIWLSGEFLSMFSHLFAWLISDQSVVLFSNNKSVTSNQSIMFFSQDK